MDAVEKAVIRARRDEIQQRMTSIIADANKQLQEICGPLQAVISEFDKLLGEEVQALPPVPEEITN